LYCCLDIVCIYKFVLATGCMLLDELAKYMLLKDGNTVEDAVHQLAADGCIQPLVFKFQDRLWIKLDNTAVPVVADCTADAFQQLFHMFHVFDIQYPIELWIVYGFIEKVLGVKATVGKSVVLAEFCQQVLK